MVLTKKAIPCYAMGAMDIAQALREAKAEQGWTTTKLAAFCNVSEGAARQWLSGKMIPSGDTLLLLQKTLPGFQERLLGTGEAKSHAS